MLALTIIGVLASCLALAIQFKDSFKESSKLRDKLIFLTYGFMLGVIITATTKVTVTFGEELFFKHIVTYTFVLFCASHFFSFLAIICFLKRMTKERFISTPSVLLWYSWSLFT